MILKLWEKSRLASLLAFVVHAIPKLKEVYPFEGKIRINDQNFTIVKIAAHLAKNSSFWAKRVQFLREYRTSTAGLASKEETNKGLIR